MRVIKKYNQYRRDCSVDMECEGCGYIEIGRTAYDDRNMWDNVIPKWKCPECNKSTNDLLEEGKITKEDLINIETKYSDFEVI